MQRRWLTYNALGGVNTRQDDGFNAVEVVLHDSARARRRPAILNDFYFFSMAALGPQVGHGLSLLSKLLMSNGSNEMVIRPSQRHQYAGKGAFGCWCSRRCLSADSIVHPAITASPVPGYKLRMHVAVALTLC